MSFADIQTYNDRQTSEDKAICDILSATINAFQWFTECKIRHAHPVWFIDWNPIVGYSKLKDSVRLLFWSGQSFETTGLVAEWSFKAADKRYTHSDQIDTDQLKARLAQAKIIQRDYKNIVKRKWVLERLV